VFTTRAAAMPSEAVVGRPVFLMFLYSARHKGKEGRAKSRKKGHNTN